MIKIILAVLIGYFFGSFPSGYLAVKVIKGTDIREFGSGNVGGTNAGRVLGKKWGVTVTIIDMLKGGFAVLLCLALGFTPTVVAVAAFFSVLGHNYPVWLDFRGGKGVATTFGTLFFVHLWPSAAAVLCGGLVWLVVMKTSRYVSLASLLSMFAMAALLPLWGTGSVFGWLALSLAVLSTWRHRTNIQRLINGSENKTGTN